MKRSHPLQPWFLRVMPTLVAWAGEMIALAALALPTLVLPTRPALAAPVPATVAPAGWEPIDCREAWPAKWPLAPKLKERLRCGWAIVPENRDRPQGRQIRLATVFYDAPGTKPDDLPLLFAQGGPGGSTLALAADWLLTATQPGLDRRDLLFVEQRGTQESQPYLFCQETYEFDRDHLQELSSDDLDARRNVALAACRDRFRRSGVDLSAYNSLENAADLVAVAAGLGYRQFDFYGVSYGSALGQHLLRDYPDRLRAVVLDAVVPLDLSFAAEAPRTGDRVLRRLFDRCAADLTCSQAYPNLPQDFSTTVAQLDRSPVQALVFDQIGYEQAQSALGVNSDLSLVPSQPYQRQGKIDGRGFVNLLGQAFYDVTLVAQLPQLIEDVKGGENSSLNALTGDLLAPFADAMYQSTVCRDDGQFQPQNPDFSMLLPELASGVDDIAALRRSCQVWQVDRLDDRVRTPPQTDIPTLLLSGEFDPITPPDYAQRVAQHLSRAYTVEFPGLSHGVFATDACATTIVRDFLNNPLSPPDATCTQIMGFGVWSPTVPHEFTSVAVPLMPVRWSVPKGWQQDPSVATHIWSAPQKEEGSILFMMAVGDRSAATAVQRLGLAFPLESIETRVVTGRTWTIFAPIGRIYGLRAAATTLGTNTYLTVVESPQTRVRDAVLAGAIAGFQPVRRLGPSRQP